MLIDDIFDSGATVKEVGKLLTNFGAIKIAPIIIARTVGRFSMMTEAAYWIALSTFAKMGTFKNKYPHH